MYYPNQQLLSVSFFVKIKMEHYSKFHGVETIKDGVIPVYRLPINSVLLDKIQYLIQKKEFFEKDILLGCNYRYLPEFRALSMFLKTAYLDLMVFRINDKKFVWLYLATDYAYTGSPQFFGEHYLKPNLFMHSFDKFIDLKQHFNFTDTFSLLQRYNVDIKNKLQSVDIYQYLDEIIVWADPFDSVESGLDYYSPKCEVEIQEPSMLLDKNIGRLRLISNN